MGDSRLSPLVFLHGFLGSGSDWLSVARQFSHQFFCILPDLPGHGENVELPLSEPVNFDKIVAGLNYLLDELELERVNLLGYSMGGRIALYFSTKFPHRVEHLILEGANPGIADERSRLARATLDDQRAEQLRNLGIDTFVDRWYQMMLFGTLKKHPQILEQLKIRRKQNDARWAAKIISELSPGRQPSLWHRLGQLPMPVLLLAGQLDEKYADLMGQMAAKIPQAILEIVPGAGHNVHLEAPQPFIKGVEQFLQN